jgi:hypothetical protein
MNSLPAPKSGSGSGSDSHQHDSDHDGHDDASRDRDRDPHAYQRLLKQLLDQHQHSKKQSSTLHHDRADGDDHGDSHDDKWLPTSASVDSDEHASSSSSSGSNANSSLHLAANDARTAAWFSSPSYWQVVAPGSNLFVQWDTRSLITSTIGHVDLRIRYPAIPDDTVAAWSSFSNVGSANLQLPAGQGGLFPYYLRFYYNCNFLGVCAQADTPYFAILPTRSVRTELSSNQ